MLPPDLQEEIDHHHKEATRKYETMYFNVALAYGGQRELVDAARSLARQVKAGEIRAEEVDEDLIAQHLYPQGGISVPKVDLIIRTGGDTVPPTSCPGRPMAMSAPHTFAPPTGRSFSKIDFLRAIRTAQTRACRPTGLIT